MLLAICYIQFTFNTGRFEFLLVANFSYTEQRFLWTAFFIAFASKVPMIPFGTGTGLESGVCAVQVKLIIVYNNKSIIVYTNASISNSNDFNISGRC